MLGGEGCKMDRVYKVDLVLVIISLVVLIGLVGYARPLVIAPLDEFETTNSSILFSIEKAGEILIDDNIEFTSPDRVVVEEGLVINLKPGTYYWKAVGVLKSEIRTLTINSEVSLRLKNLGESYGLVNAGNVGLNVEVYNGTSLVESVKLEVDEEVGVSGDKFVGGQDE